MANSTKENQTKNLEQEQNQVQNGQSQNGKEDSVRADKGSGYFPLTDMQFDVVMVLNEKSKALQAYDKYLLDAQPCSELTEVFEKIRRDDREHVEALKMYL